MAMHYDIIAFDLDGTLTPSKSPLEKDMAELLCQLLTHYKVAVISGASYGQFEHQFLSHLPCPPEYLLNLFILPANGSTFCTYRGAREPKEDSGTAGWTCVTESPFTEEEKEMVYHAFEKAFAATAFVKPQKTYGPILEDRVTQVTFSAWGMEAPLDIKAAWDPDHIKREKMVAVLKPLLPGFSVHIGGTTSIDVTRVGIDKAYGLKKLLAELHISAERMLYIGDELFPDGNDAPAQTIGATCQAVENPEATKAVIHNILRFSIHYH
jgi:HAD superfamily hydrolase (TIGR01484 family)